MGNSVIPVGNSRHSFAEAKTSENWRRFEYPSKLGSVPASDVELTVRSDKDIHHHIVARTHRSGNAPFERSDLPAAHGRGGDHALPSAKPLPRRWDAQPHCAGVAALVELAND